jgi:hypothetical protein
MLGLPMYIAGPVPRLSVPVVSRLSVSVVSRLSVPVVSRLSVSAAAGSAQVERLR